MQNCIKILCYDEKREKEYIYFCQKNIIKLLTIKNMYVIISWQSIDGPVAQLVRAHP